MTGVASVVALVVGIFLLLRITSHRTVSAGFFTLAVFISGIAGMVIYVVVKDGVGAVLKRAGGGAPAEPRPVSAVDTAETGREPAPEPEPEPEAEPEAVSGAAKRRRPQLRATVPPEPDDDEAEEEVEAPAPRQRPVSSRQRPLRPRD